MIAYANYFMIVFLNTNLNVRNERKMVIKLRWCTYKITHITYNVDANIPGLSHLVLTYSLDILLYLINSHCVKFSIFFKFINIDVNNRNERKNV